MEMKGEREKEECGNRKVAYRFGYGSVATRFTKLLLSFFFKASFVFLFQSSLCLSFSELLLSSSFFLLFFKALFVSFSYQSVRR